MSNRPTSTIPTKMAQTLQSDLSKIGVKLKLLDATPADFYAKYMPGSDRGQARGVGPRTRPAGARTGTGTPRCPSSSPLFSGPPSYPPVGSNFGFYNNPTVNALIAKGASAASASCGGHDLGAGRRGGHEGRAVLPDRRPEPAADHASYVHNAVYVPAIQQFDPTNVWLSSPG